MRIFNRADMSDEMYDDYYANGGDPEDYGLKPLFVTNIDLDRASEVIVIDNVAHGLLEGI